MKYSKFTEWAIESNTNVCYLTYALDKVPENRLKQALYVIKLLKSHRLQYAAKIVRDLVLNIRVRCKSLIRTNACWKDMSKVTVVGFSLGAHVASQICKDLYQRTGEKVGKLIGIDPAGIQLILMNYDQSFIDRKDAAYVQVIHADTLFFGTANQCGTVDIYVKDLPTD